MSDLTRIELRRGQASVEILNDPAEQIAYQHTVFCQTCLPYKNVLQRTWERKQGAVFLRIEAGAVRRPGDAQYYEVGLPYGSRPRLIMAHLNREAICRQSPIVDVESTFTAFIKRVLNARVVNAREINRFKDQLTRFAAATVRMSVDLPDNRAYQINTQIIDAMELWDSGFYGLHMSNYHPGIMKVLENMLSPWMSGQLQHFLTLPWLWMCTPGLRKGFVE